MDSESSHKFLAYIGLVKIAHNIQRISTMFYEGVPSAGFVGNTDYSVIYISGNVRTTSVQIPWKM